MKQIEFTLERSPGCHISAWLHDENGSHELAQRKYPAIIICPGGGYSMICSFVEGLPYAKRLNEQGYSAFVLYYRCRKKARYPAPMEDLARALGDILNRLLEAVLEHPEWNNQETLLELYRSWKTKSDPAT